MSLLASFERNCPFSELADEWQRYSEGLVMLAQKRPGTHKNQMKVLRTLREKWDSTRLSEITRPAIKIFAGERAATGLKSTTVNAELRVLSAILHYAEEQGYIPEAPRIPYLPEPMEERDLPSPALVQEFVNTLPSYHRLPLLMSLYTGMSWHEICRLRWKDIGPVSIKIGFDGMQVKTGLRRRELPITPAVREIVREARAQKGELAGDGSPVFPSAPATRQYLVRQRTHKYGMISPSVMRKVFASMVAEASPEHVLQKLLGHAPGSRVTRKHYIRSHKDAMKEAMSDVARRLPNGPKSPRRRGGPDVGLRDPASYSGG
jgi:integrase